MSTESPPSLFESISEAIPPMEGWSSIEKCIALAGCVTELKAAISVDLGTFGGRAWLALAMAHREQKKGVAYGVDPLDSPCANEGDGHDAAHIKYWAAMNWERIYQGTMKAAIPLREYARFYQMPSRVAYKLFDKASINALHQDSNRCEKVSCEEVELWLPLMAPDAYWIQDDAHDPRRAKSQQMLLDAGWELTLAYPTWKIFQNKGIDKNSKPLTDSLQCQPSAQIASAPVLPAALPPPSVSPVVLPEPTEQMLSPKEQPEQPYPNSAGPE